MFDLKWAKAVTTRAKDTEDDEPENTDE